MALERVRSYFGFKTPKHRRNSGSRSLMITGVTAVVVIVIGLVFTLLNRGSNELVAGSSPTNMTTTGPTPTTAVPASSSVSTRATTTAPTVTTGDGSSGSASSSTSTTQAPALLSPSEVAVDVLNGTGAQGQASIVSSALHSAGFQLAGEGNASSFSYATTVIAYPPGKIAWAQTLAHYVAGATSLEASASVPSNEVQLVVGSSYAGVSHS